MSDLRSMAIQRTVSQIRGKMLYQFMYRVDDEEGSQREINLFMKLHGENLKNSERENFTTKIGKNANPNVIYEVFQILALKVGSPNDELTFTRSECDSDLLELVMSTDLMIKISNLIQDVYIENIMMIQNDPCRVPGAPNQIKTTTIGIGLIMN